MKIKLNPDEELVNKVLLAMKETDGYCPCAILKNDDTKCMCKDFREMTTPGQCHCGLYVKEMAGGEE